MKKLLVLCVLLSSCSLAYCDPWGGISVDVDITVNVDNSTTTDCDSSGTSSY